MTIGIELARLADLPADVLSEGKRVASNLAELDARNQGDSESTKIALRRKALLRVIISFFLSAPSSLPSSVFRQFWCYSVFALCYAATA